MVTIAGDSLYALAEDIIRIHGGGGLRNNSELSITQVGHWINTHYAEMVHSEMVYYEQRDMPVPSDLWTTLVCRKLDKKDKSGCDCINTGCVVKYIKLPNYISKEGKPLIKAYTTTYNEEIKIYNNPTSASNGINGVGGFGGSKITAYLIGQELVFAFPPDKINTCFVTIVGVFAGASSTYGCKDIWSRSMGIPQRFLPEIRKRILALELNATVRNFGGEVNPSIKER